MSCQYSFVFILILHTDSHISLHNTFYFQHIFWHKNWTFLDFQLPLKSHQNQTKMQHVFLWDLKTSIPKYHYLTFKAKFTLLRTEVSNVYQCFRKCIAIKDILKICSFKVCQLYCLMDRLQRTIWNRYVHKIIALKKCFFWNYNISYYSITSIYLRF